MEKLDPTIDGTSQDVVADNIGRLRELFPEIFVDGMINFDALKEALGEHVDDHEERYDFTWFGKTGARRIAQTSSGGTLLPRADQSVDWDTTRNLFIEGDNLEVLKLLQKSYHRKFKLIYIDPPYNTGKEFVYPDKYQDNLSTYLRYTGQMDAAGYKFSSNPETSGRWHTNWLNMMFPRLKLARNLLRDDGVIFVSIDDREVHNLRHLLDEVFGSENWLGTVVWKNATDNNPSQIAIEHEYVLVYSREKAALSPSWRSPVSDVKDLLLRTGQDFIKEYPNQDERQAAYSDWFRSNKAQLWPMDRYKYIDGDGIYIGSQSVHNPGKEGYRYDVIHPVTGKPCKQPLMGYRFPQEAMARLLAEEKILFGNDHNKIIELKVYAREFMDKLPSVMTLDGRLGTYDLRTLFPEVSKIFTNPKPVKLLMEFFSLTLGEDDLVMDFFAGSCPTAEAVLRLNAKDGGSRRFVVVQLPEAVDESTDVGKQAASIGLKSISQIGAERVRRAALSISSNSSESEASGDLGFRFFRLDSSNIKTWDADFEALEQSLLDVVENIKPDRTEDDVLFELLLKYGLDLSVPIEPRIVRDKKVYIIDAGALVVCLAKGVTIKVVEGIAALKAELSPEIMRVVFRDGGFVDDVVKTNTVQMLKQAGIDDVKSL